MEKSRVNNDVNIMDVCVFVLVFALDVVDTSPLVGSFSLSTSYKSLNLYNSNVTPPSDAATSNGKTCVQK